MKLDIFELLLDGYGNEIRVDIPLKFRKLIREKIHKDFKNLDEFCNSITKKSFYSRNQILGWVSIRKTLYRYPSYKGLIFITDSLGIKKETVFKSIERFKHGKGGIWTKLPRWLNINNDIIYGLGLFAAEGTKDISKQLQITNTNLDIIKFTLHWFKNCLNVQDNIIFAYIGIPESNDMELKKQLTKINMPEKRTHVRIEPHRTKMKITLTARCGVYRLLIESLLKSLRRVLIKNNSLGLSFVRGLADGDGCITKTGNRAVFLLQMNDSHFLDMAEIILHNSGCKIRREKPYGPKSTKDKIIIHGRNFKILSNLKIFRLRYDTMKKLNNISENIKEIHGVRGMMLEGFLIEFNELQKTNKCTDTITISKKLGKSRGHIAHLTQSTENKGFLKRFRNRQNQPYECELTDKGINMISKIKESEKERTRNLCKNIGVSI